MLLRIRNVFINYYCNHRDELMWNLQKTIHLWIVDSGHCTRISIMYPILSKFIINLIRCMLYRIKSDDFVFCWSNITKVVNLLMYFSSFFQSYLKFECLFRISNVILLLLMVSCLFSNYEIQSNFNFSIPNVCLCVCECVELPKIGY